MSPGLVFENSVLELVMSSVPFSYTTPWSVKLCLECSLPPVEPVQMLPSKEVTVQESCWEGWQERQEKQSVLFPITYNMDSLALGSTVCSMQVPEKQEQKDKALIAN